MQGRTNPPWYPIPRFGAAAATMAVMPLAISKSLSLEILLQRHDLGPRLIIRVVVVLRQSRKIVVGACACTLCVFGVVILGTHRQTVP